MQKTFGRKSTILFTFPLFYVNIDKKVNHISDANGEKLYQDLKANGILVRHFTDPKITSYNRITIGAMEEMEALIRTIKSLLDKAGIK